MFRNDTKTVKFGAVLLERQKLIGRTYMPVTPASFLRNMPRENKKQGQKTQSIPALGLFQNPLVGLNMLELIANPNA